MPSDLIDPETLHGISFFDAATNRKMRYIYPDAGHWTAGWIVAQNPSGEWMTWRKATQDDIATLNAELHNSAPALFAAAEERDQLRRELMCDVCAGTGRVADPEGCICGGSGHVSDAFVRLRLLYSVARRDRDRLAGENAALKAEAEETRADKVRLLRIAMAARRVDQLQRENTLYSREHLAEAWADLRAALKGGPDA